MKLLRCTPVFLCILLLLNVRAQAQLTIQIGQNFTGSTYGNETQAIPADCNGTVGPNEFVEFINDQFAVYDKYSSSNTYRISALEFWGGAVTNFPSSLGVSDPRIIYDPTCQRWFASMVDYDDVTAQNGGDVTLENNDFLLAVSTTSDPSSGWTGFRFRAVTNAVAFADFPTLGVDNNGVYLSGDIYHGTNNPLGAVLVSIPKADLLLASPTVAHRSWFGVIPYSARGQVYQPVMCLDGTSSGNVVAAGNIGMDTNAYSNVFCFAVQNSSHSNATLSAAVSLTVPPYSVPFNSDFGVPQFTATQPDGTSQLLANDARISARVYGVAGVLYAVHNTELNGHIAIRWYRISASTRALLESGTISDPNQDLIYPTIAASAAGVVVIGYNACGLAPADTLSCYVVAGLTRNGVTAFGSPVTLQTGATSFHGDDELAEELFGDPGYSRWGDYNALSMDPSDPARFWSIIMYPSDADFEDVYSTQITELIVTGPELAIVKSGANMNISWPVTVPTYTLQSSTNITSSAAWTNVTQTPVTNGNQVSVLIPAPAKEQFYRLKN